MKIRLVKGSEIDKVKWNSCVHYASNGNVFGYMWFLDHVAKDWDALVEGDYESVFPLVWRDTFFGKKVLYQPDLMRELGVYSINILSQKRINAFLEAIPSEYMKVDISLNEQNRPTENVAFEIIEKSNYQLLLNRPYEEIEAGYSIALKTQLEIAENEGLLPISNLKPEKIAEFYQKHTPIRKGLDHRFHALQRIMYNVLHRGWGFAAGITDREGALLAVNFFIYSHKKVLSLVPVCSPVGKKKGALTYLFNFFIQGHANRPLVLDFNTEETEVALGFGASSNSFYQVKRDKRRFRL